MSLIEVSIITVGMNHKAYIKSLLNSLFVKNKPLIPFEMIYVDNCSNDGSVEYIKEYYPEVKIIVNKKPKGFGENNNTGVHHAKGKYIAIINPDIVLLQNSIDNLYQYIKSNDQIGIIAPELLNPDGTHQFSVRKFITPSIFIYRLFSGLKDSASNKKVEEYLCKNIDIRKKQNVNWVIGAMFMMTKTKYKELDGFDTKYFLYMEDEDICLRCWQKGYSVVYYPKSQVIHNHQRASSKLGKKSFIHIQSLLKFFIGHGFHVYDYVKQ